MGMLVYSGARCLPFVFFLFEGGYTPGSSGASFWWSFVSAGPGSLLDDGRGDWDPDVTDDSMM